MAAIISGRGVLISEAPKLDQGTVADVHIEQSQRRPVKDHGSQLDPTVTPEKLSD
jgi:hypothetical protein